MITSCPTLPVESFHVHKFSDGLMKLGVVQVFLCSERSDETHPPSIAFCLAAFDFPRSNRHRHDVRPSFTHQPVHDVFPACRPPFEHHNNLR